jgi:hypothetical protein
LGFDAASDEAATIRLEIPIGWNGIAPDVAAYWEATTAVDGTDVVVWVYRLGCVGAGESDDPAYNLAGTAVSGTASATLRTVSALAAADIPVTGCAASEMMYLQIIRDGDNGTDTYNGDAELVAVRVTFIIN